MGTDYKLFEEFALKFYISMLVAIRCLYNPFFGILSLATNFVFLSFTRFMKPVLRVLIFALFCAALYSFGSDVVEKENISAAGLLTDFYCRPQSNLHYFLCFVFTGEILFALNVLIN